MSLHCIGILCHPKNGYTYNEINEVADSLRHAEFIGVRIYDDKTDKISDIDIATIKKNKTKIRNICNLDKEMMTKDMPEAIIVCDIINGVVKKKLVNGGYTIICKYDDFHFRICINAGEKFEMASTIDIRKRNDICTNCVVNTTLIGTQKLKSKINGLIAGDIKRDLDFDDITAKILNQYKRYRVMLSADKINEKMTTYIESLGIHAASIGGGIVGLKISDNIIWVIVTDELTNYLLYDISMSWNDRVTKIYINSISSGMEYDYNSRISKYTKYIVLGSKVNHVNDKLFYCCVGIESITIVGDNVSFGNCVFSGCIKLKNIEVLGNEVTYKNIIASIVNSGLNLRKITIKTKE